MAVIVGRTKEQLRLTVGEGIGAVKQKTMTAAGTAQNGVDSTLPNADDSIAGNRVVFTSGTNDGAIRTINSFTGASKTWTIRGDDLAAATADGDTYELWSEDPEVINNYINRAIRTVPRKGAPTVTDLSLHGYRDRKHFTIPTAVVGIQHVSYRTSFTNTLIHNCNSVWDELVDANVTASADTEDYAEGTGANKFVLAAALGVGDIIASDDFSALNISKHDYVEFWIKSTVALTAGQLSLRLSSTASAGTATEELAIPATSAATWTFHRVALANPQSDTAIISVGLIHTADIGAATVWVDDIRAVVDASAHWEYVHRNHRSIDKDRRVLMLDVGYNLIRMEGVKKPTELTADTTTCDVEPEYIIARSIEYYHRAEVAGHGESRGVHGPEADRAQGTAEAWMNRMRMPQAIQWVDD